MLAPARGAPAPVQGEDVKLLAAGKAKKQMGEIQIERVTTVTDELMAAFERLMPQLSPQARLPERDTLAQIVASPTTTLYIARDAGGTITGALTLAIYRTPLALHAWIEDVVVDEKMRGQGIGAALTQRGLEHARAAGAKSVNLTSRPAREAANRLYQNLGFVRWETNAYRFNFKE